MGNERELSHLTACVQAKPGRLLRLPESCASTNEQAKALAAAGKLSVVLARRQTAGRGRLGRSFESGEGGLYMSMSWQPELPAEQCLPCTALAALAAAEAIEKLTGAKPEIKWPNDLLLKGKKICGILTEGLTGIGGFVMVFGIGVNLRNRLSPELTQAAGLEQLLGSAPAPEMLAAEIVSALDRILAAFESGQGQTLMERYGQCCMTVGREVTVLVGGQQVEGLAVAVDRDGALLVQQGTVIHRVFSGEATLKK